MARLAISALAVLSLVTGHIITSPASISVRPTAYPGVAVGGLDGLYGQIPGRQLWERADTTEYCDEEAHGFVCPTGTCYTGGNGVIGCCSVSSCAPRTTCIEFNAHATSSCDINTGGCLTCSDPAAPYCATVSNEANGQYINWCNSVATKQVTSYSNPVTDSAVRTSSTTDPTDSAKTASPWTGTVTPIPATAASSSTSSDVGAAGAKTEATDTPVASPHQEAKNSLSSGAVGGIAVGAIAGVALLALGALWFLIKKVFPPKKQRPQISGPFNFRHDDGVQPSTVATTTQSSDSLKGDELPLQRPQTTLYSPDSLAHLQGHPERPNTTAAVNTSEKDADSSRYTVTNPDPKSPYEAYRPFAPRAGTVEAPTDRPLSMPTVSPIIGGNRDSTTTTTTGGYPSPMVVNRDPWPPRMSSLPQNQSFNGQPAYTPSTYQAQPPDSIQHASTQQPPSLPQEYSTADMAFQGGSPVYRGLRREGESDAPPSWAFLSPEAARNGQWVNDSPTRAQRPEQRDQGLI